VATKPKPIKKPADEGPKQLYEVTSPLNHDGEDYAIGDQVELTDAQAEPMLAHTVKLVAA
jgi:hypothetical protein